MGQPKTTNTLAIKKIRGLINTNLDSRMYFFANIDAAWFDWLHDNGFFEVIQNKAENPTEYRYSIPEISYLERMSNEIPHKVVDFMLTVPISSETFNPEVIARFLRICGGLSAEQLARMVPKIRDEKWVQLMAGFGLDYFDFERMLNVLSEARDDVSIIALAQAMLTVRVHSEVEQSPYKRDGFFCINDIEESSVFERLASVSNERVKSALRVVIEALSVTASLGGVSDDGFFKMRESFSLHEVDFFTLKFSKDRHGRGCERDLIVAATTLVTKALSELYTNPVEAKKMFDEFIEPLPDSRTMWRFRLFVWSLCPSVFKTELRNAFFQLVEHAENSFSIAGGAEYKQALKKAFSILGDGDRRKYVCQLFEKFPSQEDGAFAWNILQSIKSSLTQDEMQKAELFYARKFDDKEYVPTPSFGLMRGGMVIPQAPSDDESIWQGSIEDIVAVLKTKWSPESLINTYSNDDFLRPRNAEGVGDRLKKEIKLRFSDYSEDAALFFDRMVLDSHYTYVFLQGLREAIQADRPAALKINWHSTITLLKAIVKSGIDDAFDIVARNRERLGWLASWTAVHDALADVLLEFLSIENEKSLIDFQKHRAEILQVIKYLFAFPDPTPKDEQLETASTKVKSPDEEDYHVADPYTVAINSVRGRAFQVLLRFAYLDAERFDKNAPIQLADDIKRLYEDILESEKTRAIRFMLGHHLAFFYYRDRVWVRGLLEKIFSKEPLQERLSSASWEGYISASLYQDLFNELKSRYSDAIQRKENDKTQQQYFADPGEALASHIALAFLHFKDFTFTSDLFVKFWNEKNSKRHEAFVSFIGRHVITRQTPEQWFLDNHQEVKNKLIQLWDWILSNVQDPDIYGAFEFWINTKVFEPVWLADHLERSLKITSGHLDWDIGLMDSLNELAQSAPGKTLEILNLYLLDGQRSGNNRWFIQIPRIKEILRMLYGEPDTKIREGVRQLINDLLPLGNGRFWELKDILN